MANYVFFLSYARDDYDPSLQSFFDQLNNRVRGLTGKLVREPVGYLDQQRKQGDEWDKEMAEAAANADVLVCLYSPAYFRKPYCGKEVQVFLDRRKEYFRQNRQRAASVIPIVWLPCEDDDIPKTLPKFLYTDADLTKYQEDGLAYFASLRENDEYTKLIWNFAKRIKQVRKDNQLPSLNPVPGIDAVWNAFEPRVPPYDLDYEHAATGPDAAVFVYASDSDWKSGPFGPPDKNAFLYLASAIATGKEVIPHQLTFRSDSADLIDKIQTAALRNSPMILMVDGASLDSHAMQDCFADFDQREFDRVAVIILWRPGTRSDALRHTVDNIFERTSKRREPFFFDNVDDAKKLSAAIAAALDALQNRVTTLPQQTRNIAAESRYSTPPQIQGPGRTAA